MRLPLTMIIAALPLLALAAACGDDAGQTADPGTAQTVAAETSRVARSPAPASSPTLAANASPGATPQAGATVEVTGVVGAIDKAQRRIDINRLSGASVTVVEVPPTAAIRRAGGTRTSLADIQPSDRIVAEGRLSANGNTLIADEITIQGVVSPGSPGG